jgi:hypothetical protein
MLQHWLLLWFWLKTDLVKVMGEKARREDTQPICSENLVFLDECAL